MTIVRIEHALSMLRMDLVQRFAHDDWSDAQVEQVARTVVACLRPGRDAVGDHVVVQFLGHFYLTAHEFPPSMY